MDSAEGKRARCGSERGYLTKFEKKSGVVIAAAALALVQK
jgi:hypothetical protein